MKGSTATCSGKRKKHKVQRPVLCGGKGSLRTLLIDIETAPLGAWTFDTRNVFLNLDQFREDPRMLCFAAKWRGERKVSFFAEWQPVIRSGVTDGHAQMVKAAHELLTEADVVEHYNGERFDTPWLNWEFVLAGLGPPAPFQQIDLCKAVQRRFRVPSSKLAYVTRALGYKGKLSHEGFGLWRKVLAGDQAAQKRMERYNVQDVRCLDDLHDRLLPWIPGLPSKALYEGDTHACPGCGSRRLERRGFAYTQVSKYQRYVCLDCGKWSRDVKRVMGSAIRPVAAS